MHGSLSKVSPTHFDTYLSMEIKTKEGGELEARLRAYIDYDAAPRSPSWDFDAEPKDVFLLQVKSRMVMVFCLRESMGWAVAERT